MDLHDFRVLIGKWVKKITFLTTGEQVNTSFERFGKNSNSSKVDLSFSNNLSLK